ncbi:hypothetical protein CO669_04090 [Bradyrhizobium sp. Y36]|uniref:hypothetical protein n=1 Tax=Bradyrhizobium sp. Y36 TaxID=2035447 RepID=UPI000BE85729|nr:hypothetical protein [Bradyrhizobium sp. Y36]PDT91208.1 hypothetical protein CO669_04090 [Bradyrhizobium sp. Y36]
MSKGHHKVVAAPSIITVGELIDQLCRLPDTAIVHFRCSMLGQELAFERLRKRSKDDVEIAINVYPERSPVLPSSDGAFRTRSSSPSLGNGALLHKARG